MDLEPVRIVVKHTFLNFENSIGTLSEDENQRRASDPQVRYYQRYVPEVVEVSNLHSWAPQSSEMAPIGMAPRQDAVNQNSLPKEREHQAEEDNNGLCSLSDIKSADGDVAKSDSSSGQVSRASSLSANRPCGAYGVVAKECELEDSHDDWRRSSVSSIMTNHSDLLTFFESWPQPGSGSAEALLALPQVPTMSMLTTTPQMQHAGAAQQLPIVRQRVSGASVISLGAKQHGSGASAVSPGVERSSFPATTCGADLPSLAAPPERTVRPTDLPPQVPSQVAARQAAYPGQSAQAALQQPQPMYRTQQVPYPKQGASSYCIPVGSQTAHTSVAVAAYAAAQPPRPEVGGGRCAGLGAGATASPQRLPYRGQQMQPPPRAKAPPQVNLLTTLMMRNFPEGFSRNMLIRMLDDAGFSGVYDFVYMPVNFKTKTPFGYAFVNMVTPNAAQYCCDYFQGFKQWGVLTDKVCEVSWSNTHQGLAAHLQRYRNSPVMHESVPDEYRPVLYAGGVRVAFPPPTKKLRIPRVRKTPASFGDDSEEDASPEPLG